MTYNVFDGTLNLALSMCLTLLNIKCMYVTFSSSNS